MKGDEPAVNFWQNKTLQRRWFLRFLLLVALLLLPVAVLAVYARPSADDYIYAAETHAVLQQNGLDIPGLLAAAWETNAYFFENWQGLYVSGFVLALQPGIFGNAWYGVTLLCVLVPLFLCLYAALRLIVKKLEPTQTLLPVALAVLLCYAFIEGLPSPVEGLYWFNGAMNYIPFFALAVLNAGLCVRLCFAKSNTRAANCALALCSALVGLVIGGGHQVVGVLNILLLLLVALLCLRHKNAWVCLPLAAAVLGLLINVTAPGTSVRAGGLAQAGFVEAVVKSFLLAAMQCIRWLDVPLLCLLALLVLPLYHLSKSVKLPDNLFRAPLAGPAVTFVLMWAMIFLPSYTMGGIGAGRLLNVVWMSFVLGCAVSLFLLLGWLGRCKKLPLANVERWLCGYARYLPRVAVVLILLMACIGSRTVKEGYDNRFATSLEAVYELANGEAAAFADALDGRERILTDAEIPNAEIRPLTAEQRPYLLFFTDVAPGPDLWGLTPYYDKESVTIVEP